MEESIFSTEGRIRRSTYWIRYFIAFLLLVLAFQLSDTFRFPGLYEIISIPVTVFVVIQGVKRMHDVNRSGWYLLIPFYNLFLILTDGDIGTNHYGDDPKGR